MAQSVSIAVNGMKCGGCESTVKKAVTAIEGVIRVEAFHADKRVDVEFDDAKTSLEAIEDAIIDAGFSVD